MKILIVSYFFPPFNQIGAVRVGKFAKYWSRMGHDVRVLACRDVPLPKGLPLEVDAARVTYAGSIDVNRPVAAILGKKKVASKGYAIGGSTGRGRSMAESIYRSFLHVPDGQVGWLPFAMREGGRICRDWRPDVIYASAPPVTSLLIARRLSGEFQSPWVAEFRDLWTHNHNRNVLAFREALDGIWERRLVKTVAGLVTVSEPLAETLKARHGACPVLTLPNGYDREDFERDCPEDEGEPGTLNLAYTGMLYPERYDLQTFFSALAATRKARIRVRFYGRYTEAAVREAERFGVSSSIFCHDPVPYHQSICLQKRSDILLMLLWNDPGQKGVYTGKLFEYLASLRPILAVGPADNVAGELIQQRRAGLVADEPERIAEWLDSMWAEKMKAGVLAPNDGDVAKGFERSEQASRLLDFLRNVTNKA